MTTESFDPGDDRVPSTGVTVPLWGVVLAVCGAFVIGSFVGHWQDPPAAATADPETTEATTDVTATDVATIDLEAASSDDDPEAVSADDQTAASPTTAMSEPGGVRILGVGREYVTDRYGLTLAQVEVTADPEPGNDADDVMLCTFTLRNAHANQVLELASPADVPHSSLKIEDEVGQDHYPQRIDSPPEDSGGRSLKQIDPGSEATVVVSFARPRPQMENMVMRFPMQQWFPGAHDGDTAYITIWPSEISGFEE